MRFVVIYFSGILLGLLIGYIRENIQENKEKSYVHVIICYNKGDCKENKKIKIILFFIIFTLIFAIILIAKYDLWGNIKKIITDMIEIAKSVITFLAGLCTPYLTNITTKKLKKLRNKIKRKEKRRKIIKFSF